MDRLISLLAALVGLIALAGAVLVEIHGQSERQAMASELSSLKLQLATMESAAQQSAAKTTTAPQPKSDGTLEALLALQNRIKVLEDDAAQAPAVPATEVASATTNPLSAITADGPSTNCIPLGTRFMAAVGDDTAICKTKVVVKVSEVDDGSAVVDGAGPITAGGFAKLGFNGCTVMVFSSDTASGFAELRVTCQ